MSQLISVVIPPLAQSFLYDVPSALASSVDVGYRVMVPFGKRRATGFVIRRHTDEPPAEPRTFELRSVSGLLEKHPCFSPAQLEFFEWVADYYGAPLATVIDVAIPPSVPAKHRRFVAAVPGAISADETLKRASAQREILSFITESPAPIDAADLNRRFKGASAALRKLEERGFIRLTTEEIAEEFSTESAPQWAKGEVSLNAAQEAARKVIVDAAIAKRFTPFLLHGITGSGKTEVYIEAIRAAREAGLGALVIVPEIALTPQLIDRFRARLGDDIGVLHSGLHRRTRWNSWRALIERRAFVAIGARSAVFAPVHDLGLIIVDEEHDGSYKQNDGLRYHARDLAVLRAKMCSCPVVLGSATPSLETFHHVLEGRYVNLPLPQRHNETTTLAMELVDLNTVKPWEMPSKNISPRLAAALSEAIDRGEQAFILYNRRGFARYLQCDACEAVLECPNCSVTLTYHQNRNALLCHYCNHTATPPEQCPKCVSCAAAAGRKTKPGSLTLRGSGTEKVFDELREIFPGIPIERLDRDAADDLEVYKKILADVRSGHTRILVGTQMIAKGHDLPGVTLVGVIDCDVGLHMPDFRAAERVFQLLTQASGRAGRGDRSGRVILQTRVPKHQSLVRTLAKDYNGFAKIELGSRKAMSYPPFSRLLRIVCSSMDQTVPIETLAELRSAAERFVASAKLEVTILGPAPAPISKIKALWRGHLLLKAKSATALNRVMKHLQGVKIRSKNTRLTFDMDPQDMM